MKAIQYTGYGKSDVIQLNEVDKPVPKEKEILISIAAISVNPMEIKVRIGAFKDQIPVNMPYLPGGDVAGTVEAIGDKVSRFKVGDKVFATTFGGTYAQYVTLDENKAAIAPNNANDKEAAALAVPLVTAYTFLVQNGNLQAGQKVLIQGAAGAVGAVMVQMAKALGAYVIGVASGEGVALIKSLGADEAIDHKTQDFTQLVKDVDLLIDLVGGETQTKSFTVVKAGGTLLSAVMPPSNQLAEKYHITAGFASSEPSHKKLEFGKALVEQGEIKAQISQVLKLEDAAMAQDLVTAGGLNGKVVLVIN